MFRQKRVDRFQFDNDQVLDDQVHPECQWNFEVLVHNVKTYLPSTVQPTKPKFMDEAGFISRFKQARPELFLDLDRGADDQTRNPVQFTIFRNSAPSAGFRAFCVQLFGHVKFRSDSPMNSSEKSSSSVCHCLSWPWKKL